MLNYLWAGMILVGIIWAVIHGTLNAVTVGILNSAKEAVSLSMTMLGVLAFWNGILEVGNRSGLLEWLADKMFPVIHFLFPELPAGHSAIRPIAVNIVANILGMGNAALPSGLTAMKELQKLNIEQHGFEKAHIASNEMCAFLVLNISSLQLIPVNMIAYRSEYGSMEPAAVTGPAMIATIVSTVTAVIFIKVLIRSKVP